MALLHRTTLRPTKLELLSVWLPTRHWFQGEGDVERVAGFRFDDPAGEVGVETMLVRSGDGPVHQVPLTYRAAPLTGGEDFLVGIAEHGVLGRRWLYDACGDPVYATALTRAILADGGQSEEYFEEDGRREVRAPSMTVTGSGGGEVPTATAVRQVTDGDPTRIVTDTVELTVLRRLGGTESSLPSLTGIWNGRTELLAHVGISD
ncbi:CG0192-related protein [Actinophytocola sp.]|uniref:CG0192-related protein n=1 Tax=Actinophytocola sp. TaxID=1872138 RepID=UPI00389A410C